MALTPKQEDFVREYLKDLNGKQAAIRAGYAQGSAEVTASRLLRNAKVSAALSDAQAERSKRVEIDADWVLRRLAAEADADVADLYDDEGSLKPVKEWPLIWRQGLVGGIDVEEIREDGVTVGQIRKVKLSDRIKRIELIGKHVGVQAFRDQVQTTGAISINISSEDAEL